MADTPEEIAYEITLRRLDSQLSNVDVIENKAGVVLGLASTLIAIFAGFLALAADDLASVIVAVPFGTVILLMYLRIMQVGLQCLQTGDWDERPNWDELLQNVQQYGLATLQMWVAEACVHSLHENQPKVQKKAKDLNRSIRLTMWYGIIIALGLFAVFIVNAATD